MEVFMVYLLITAGVFFADFGIKRYMDKKYARKVGHPRLGGRIVIEKFYNKGAALNFLAKKPGLMKGLHTAVLIITGTVYYFLLQTPGKNWGKPGLRCLWAAGFPIFMTVIPRGMWWIIFGLTGGRSG